VLRSVTRFYSNFNLSIIILKRGFFFNIKNLLGISIKNINIVSGFSIEFAVLVKYIYPVFFFLKKHSLAQFNLLIDIICYDCIKEKKRFVIVYNLLSVRFNIRLSIRTKLSCSDKVLSLIGIYKSVGWAEREVFDFFGVFFFENRDLRRILTDYGFKGFPLRKDFPMTGYLGVYYDDIQKRVCYSRLEISQEYRNFELKRW